MNGLLFLLSGVIVTCLGSFAQIPTVTLQNAAQSGVEMPAVGLGVGTYRVLYPNGTWGPGFGEKWDDATAQVAVSSWLKLGGRRIDTSLRWYHDDGGVGAALQDALPSIPRSQIFITGKVDEPFGRNESLDSIRRQIALLQTSYLDLVLMHWPAPMAWDFETTAFDTTNVYTQTCGSPSQCRVACYQGMLDAMNQGLVRAVGVANFEKRHLQDLIDAGLPLPAVNQIEFHPFWHQDDWVKEMQSLNITVNSYSPYGAPDYMSALPWKWPTLPLDDASIVSIAQSLGVTPAQVVGRWHHQKGIVLNPRSLNATHMLENLSIFQDGFSLTADQMRTIDNTPRPLRNKVCPDPALLA